MAESEERLTWDLAIMREMAAEMEAYIKSEVMFWPMSHSDMPKLTLGGFWLRRHRLTALQALLSAGQQRELGEALRQYETAVSDWIVRTEQRAHAELAARLRLWGEYLRDVFGGKATDVAAYPAQVETRAIIAALVNQLQQAPYRLDDSLLPTLAQQDKALRARWQNGPFVWPDEWQRAYPTKDYWWLYGRPK